MQFQYSVESLGGINYFTTTDARGNDTMLFKMNGHVFVQTNRSPAKLLKDVAKKTKAVQNLLTVFEA